LQTHLPAINKFRLPCRAIVVSQFGMAVLAAVGFSLGARRSAAVGREPIQEAHLSTAILWSTVVLSLLAIAMAAVRWPAPRAAWERIALGPALLVAAVRLIHAALGGSRWPLSAMIVLTAFALGACAGTHPAPGTTEKLGQFVATTTTPDGAPSA